MATRLTRPAFGVKNVTSGHLVWRPTLVVTRLEITGVKAQPAANFTTVEMAPNVLYGTQRSACWRRVSLAGNGKITPEANSAADWRSVQY